MTAQKIIRRSSLYSRRLLHSLPLARPKPFKIVFMHLPKCAGTSLSHALYQAVPIDKRIGVIDANATRAAAGILSANENNNLAAHEDLNNPEATFKLRDQIALTHMCWGTTLIHGHILWSDLAYAHFSEKYDWVTFLRNPMDRALSNIRMNVRRKIVDDFPDFDQMLESPLARHHATTFTRYFAGQAKLTPETDLAALYETARQNATKFQLIGKLENMSRFQNAFADRFGAKLKMPHQNSGEGAALELSAAQSQKLEALCEYDLKLYEEFGDWTGA